MQTPEAVAVAYEGTQLKYRELNQQSNRLAHYLMELGIRPGARVGICVERSLEMVVGLLAILKTGAAYVPLDPRYPQDRVNYMIEDAELDVLLAQEKLAAGISSEARLVVFEREAQKIARQSEENPVVFRTPDSLAYVLYTSGSTGSPKGVRICDRNTLRLVTNTNYADFSSKQVFLQFVSLSFDVAAFEIWGALLNGACLTIFPAYTPSGEELGRWVSQSPVTTLWLTSGLFHQIVESDTGKYFHNLSQLLAGGDVLSLNLVQKFLKLYPNCRLINGYGPTENGTFSTCGELREMPADAATVTIGKPIPHSTAFVLDQEMQGLSSGQVGELYLGGDGLAQGYWKQPALTAEKFLPNPFSSTPGERLYRSGDMARYLPDGTLEFLGRIDQQVKLRGYRVELGEIEAVLEQHPGIGQAVALVREDVPGDKRLVVYVVEHSGHGVSIAELRDYLSRRLPEYMVPSAFVLVDAFPLTPNGKVDRRALPMPAGARPQLEQPYIAARTATEKLLSNIWAEVLHIDQVGAQDDFFELGGSSLLAAQVLSRVSKTHHVSLPLRKFFANPVLADLAQSVEALREETSDKGVPPIGSVSRGEKVPIGFSQERIWFIQQLDPSCIAYHFQATLNVSGALDVSALERSLTEMVQRHENLRTTFIEKDGHPVQVIHEPFRVVLPVVHLEDVEPDSRAAVSERLIQEELAKRFDVSSLPLVRWMLFSFSRHEHILLHKEHHFIHDGWSFNVFLTELLEIYKAFAAGKPSPLAPPRHQFADFALWEREYVLTEEAQAQLSYWTKKLSGIAPVNELPADRPRPSLQTFHGKLLRISLPRELSTKVHSFSHQEQVSLFVVMMSAFFALVHQYTRQDDFCVGTSLANRRHPETEGIIGMLVNNVTLRAQMEGGATLRDLLEQVRDLTLEAYENQDIPFQKVVQGLNLSRDVSINPLFQTTFNFHNSPVAVPRIADLKLRLMEALGNGTAKFDIGVIVIPSSEQRLRLNPEWSKDELTMLWEYSTDLFDESTMQRMIRYYQRLLAILAERPGQQLADVCLLEGEERQQVLVEWNQTRSDFPSEKCVQELFQEQARRTPEALAMECGTQRYTYAELDKKSNQLGRYLRKMGTGPETRVGICLERSADVVIAMLGILKAGGAYVPIDTNDPAIRLRDMAEDAQLKLVLMQQQLRDRMKEVEGKFISLDQSWDQIGKESDQDFESEVSPENLAYVMYTSGSTGKPKGVCIPHRGIARLVKGVDYAHWGPGDVFLQLAPAVFDPTTFEIWGCLLNGGELVIYPAGVPVMEELASVLREKQVNVLWLTAGLFHQVVEWQPASLAGVREVLAGGDVLSPRAVQLAMAAGCQVINGYGPTENTTFTCCYRVSKEGWSGATVPIGTPIANTQVYVLDENLQPVPVGIPGELYTGGAGLARGYLNRPDATAEKFLPDPFSLIPGERLYRTGDSVRYLPDGNLEFLGRKDHQVKVRGYRIELGEIEAVLAGHPAVETAAVIVVKDKLGDKHLAAFVKTTKQLESSTLKDYVRDKLPGYMVPSQVVIQEQLPMTNSGKIDRMALSRAAKQNSFNAAAFVLPNNEMQRTLADIWQKVLGVEKVSILDNFFELGGHSLRMLQVQSSLRSFLGRPVKVTDLFKYSTIESLARFLAEGGVHAEQSSPADANRARKLKQGKELLKQRSQTVRLRPNSQGD